MWQNKNKSLTLKTVITNLNKHLKQYFIQIIKQKQPIDRKINFHSKFTNKAYIN